MAWLGVILLVVAAALLLAGIFGPLVLTEVTFLGHTGVRNVAGLAVVGCLLAAVGFWDD